MANYFKHDYNSRNDPKLIELKRVLGSSGKGVYWDIIEMLHEQGGRLTYNTKSLSYDLREDEKIVSSVINDFDLFKNDGKIFFSNRVRKNLKKIQEVSKAASDKAFKRWSSNAQAMPQQCTGNAIREDKRREKENKETLFASFWELYGKKIDQKKCKAKFITLNLQEIEIINSKLPEYILATPEVQFRKNPLTWLNGKCWNDELTKPKFSVLQAANKKTYLDNVPNGF